MTSNDLELLRRIPDLDSEAEKQLQFWASTNLPEDEMRIRAYCDLLRIWDKSIPLLREARCVVEAHSTSGQPFPSIAEKLADCLSASHEWLNYINKPHADEWRAEAQAIVSAIRGGKDKSVSSLSFLKTNKSVDEQRRIFNVLLDKGYIATSNSQEDFLNVFNPNAKKQGQIIWTGTSTKSGMHGMPSPTVALDFVATIGQVNRSEVRSLFTQEWGETTFSVLFPNLHLSKDTRTQFINKWMQGEGSCRHAELSLIIDG